MTNIKRNIAIILMSFASAVVYAVEIVWQGPPIVGTIQLFSRNQPTLKMDGKIYINREGLRSEMPMGTTRIISITNSKSGKCWYADEGKKIYMESAYNKKTGECPSFMGGDMEAKTESPSAEALPCEGYAKKTSMGSDTVASRSVDKWSCSGGNPKSGYESETQWHDRKLKFILKNENSAGEVMQFSELIETSFSSSLLDAPKGMKRVSSE